jgi:hypothetical protein
MSVYEFRARSALLFPNARLLKFLLQPLDQNAEFLILQKNLVIYCHILTRFESSVILF